MVAKRIFLKILLASLPILALVIFYLVADPFVVLYKYENPQVTGKRHLETNEDFAQIEAYLRTAEKEKYNAFIFGSSRSYAYKSWEWDKRIPGNKSYYFGVASESLYGVDAKLRFLDKQGAEIKHVLIIADGDLLSLTANLEGHLYRKHPLTSGEGWVSFHLTSMLDFLTYEGISSYLKLPPPPPNGSPDALPKHKTLDDIVKSDPEAHYKAKGHLFVRSGKEEVYKDPVITPKAKEQLYSIKRIFDKHQTNYRIVISPLYNQKKLHPADMYFLDSLFDRQYVFNFAGANEFTASMYNYYDPNHHLIPVGNRIMDIIYNPQPADTAKWH